MAIRVLVADDNTLFREGIAELLNGEQDISVVATAKTVSGLVRAIKQFRPEIVLMELQLATRSTLSVIDITPNTVYCIITLSEAPADVINAADAGAAGYLTKAVSLEDLTQAVTTLSVGGSVIAPHLLHHLLDEFVHRTDDPDNLAAITRKS